MIRAFVICSFTTRTTLFQNQHRMEHEMHTHIFR